MLSVSSNYRELLPSEVDEVAKECANTWLDPAIPERQYELAVRSELASFRMGGKVAPFNALLACLGHLDMGFSPSLLDIGASSGMYSEVLELAGYGFEYRACDFSPAFAVLAEKLYPGIAFDVADARSLPYADNAFDVVMSGGTIMHIREYGQVIREAARVASKYVIFHRTPITADHTSFWVKDAYGIPCLEIHFNELELLSLFMESGLEILHIEDVFRQYRFGHKSYLLKKKHA